MAGLFKKTVKIFLIATIFSLTSRLLPIISFADCTSYTYPSEGCSCVEFCTSSANGASGVSCSQDRCYATNYQCSSTTCSVVGGRTGCPAGTHEQISIECRKSGCDPSDKCDTTCLAPKSCRRCSPCVADPKAAVVNEIWEDTNGNGIFDGRAIDAVLSDGTASVAACSTKTSSALKVTDLATNTALTNWACSANSPQEAYVSSGDYNYNDTAAFTLTPPTGSLCADVKWTARTCDTQACDQNVYTASGTGCTASLSTLYSPKIMWQVKNSVKPVTGYIWQDLNGDNVAAGGVDKFWSNNASPSCGQTISSGVNVKEIETDQAVFGCITPTIPYYTSAKSYPASARLNFSLIPPQGVSCTTNTVFWTAKVCQDSTCTSSVISTGTGCLASILNTNGLYQTSLYWRVVPDASLTRTITGNLYETSNQATCAAGTPINLSGLQAAAYDANGTNPLTTTVSQATGAYTISTGVNSATQVGAVCINGNLSSGTTAYALACVSASAASGSFTCTKGISGTCAINCTPNNALVTSASVNVNFGFVKAAADKWFAAVDGDFYAGNVSAYVSAAPLGMFTSNLINTETATSIGGYGFAGSQIDTQTSGSTVSEKGGYAQRLSTLPTYPFEDTWLNKFSFNVPSNPITTVPVSNVFTEGKVYSFDVAQFNTILSRGSYSFTGGNTNSPAAAIVYVKGSGTIKIDYTFISLNPGKILVLVTDAPIEISDNVGTSVSMLRVNSESQLDLYMISAQSLTLMTRYNQNTNTMDKPILMSGAAVSRSAVKLQRNLGAVDNNSYPAETIRAYPYLLNLISQYEIANGQNGSYTGLATIDVQFDYGN